MAKVKSKKFVKTAEALVGNPYLWGGNGETLKDILTTYAKNNGQADEATATMIDFINLTKQKVNLEDIHFQDCSGLVVEVLRKLKAVNSTFDLTAEGLYQICTPVKKAQRGALCFYYQNGKHNHVGICVDKSTVVHALSTKTGVIIELISERADKWKDFGLLDKYIEY